MKRTSVIALLFIAACVFPCFLMKTAIAQSENSNAEYLKEWSGPWIEDINIQIARTLVKNNVKGCGEIKYKESTKTRSKYLVHCSSDGKYWKSYLVWPSLGEVHGPYKAEIE